MTTTPLPPASQPHRLRGLRRNRLIAVLSVLIALGLCAAALRASEAGLDYYRITARLGEQAPVTGGWVQISDVRVGTVLLDDNQPKATTKGMFVVVNVQVANTGTEAVSFSDIELHTRTRTYELWDSVVVRPKPGFVDERDLVIEVDPREIDDLTMQLVPGGFVRGYDDRVFAHLGITPANADAWRAAAVDQGIEPLKYQRSRGLS